jgi:hypothetical protein
MKKYLSISELEQGDARAPIWAINGSANSKVGMTGEIHVGIPKLNGTKVDALYLAQTWLPQCLTDQIPRGQLLESSEFRNAVVSGLIILVTPEYAEDLNSQEGAAEERQSLNARERQIREALGARTITSSGAEIVNTSDLTDRSTLTTEKPALSDAFMAFVSSLETRTDIEALNALRSRGSTSRREVKHLVANLRDKPKTVKFLKDKLEASKKK